MKQNILLIYKHQCHTQVQNLVVIELYKIAVRTAWHCFSMAVMTVEI